jgi:hypothetical protein
VRFLQERFGVSERRACRVLGQQRSTQRQRAKKATEEEGRLVARMLKLVRQHPRYGYRRIAVGAAVEVGERPAGRRRVPPADDQRDDEAAEVMRLTNAELVKQGEPMVLYSERWKVEA